MLHELIKTWFHLVENWGYAGVFILMALESSIVPVPSEVVMPPAAFWAAQGRMSFWGVVVAGTLGSYAGSAISYWASLWIGLPVIRKYGKYFLFPPEKIEMAQKIVQQYGVGGVFFSRLLPVIRHLISIPAGVFQMTYIPFSVATILGAGIWCLILSWFGQQVIGAHPELLQSPEAMVAVIKEKLHWFVGAVLVLGVLYAGVVWFKRRSQQAQFHGSL